MEDGHGHDWLACPLGRTAARLTFLLTARHDPAEIDVVARVAAAAR